MINNKLIDHLQIVKCEKADFKLLQQYHYVPEDPVCVRNYYKCTVNPNFPGKYPDPLGVIVYSVPIGEWRARNLAVDNYFSIHKERSHRQSAINANVTYISRVIVDPRFHKLGIGSKLVRETIPLQNYHWIESMTPPDRYMNMFIKTGFRSVVQPTPELYINMQRTFDRVGLPRQYWVQPEIATVYLENLNKYKSDLYNRESKIFLRNFSRHEDELRGYERIRYILSKIRYPNMYFIYTREDIPLVDSKLPRKSPKK